MAGDKDFLDHVTSLLGPIKGVTNKTMFGGYGIFHDGEMFALIKGTGLFFKVDATNRPDYEKAGSKQYKPMPYYQVPAEVLGDTAKLLDWACVSMRIAHAPAAKKKR